MADKNELAQPRNIEEAIRNKVREVVFGAIPDDKIDELVENERKKFFEEPSWTSKPTEYGRQERSKSGPTLFEQMVHKEITDQLQPILKEAVRVSIFQGENATIITDSNGNNPRLRNEVLVKAICEDAGPRVVEMFVKNIVESFLGQLQQSNY